MRKEICATLTEIEKQHNVKILYACESGPEPGASHRRILITTFAISTSVLLNRI